MQTKETKDNGTKGAGFGCCAPENFKEMFEMMSKCCLGRDDTTSFAAMKKSMLQKMMEMGCGPETTENKKDTGRTRNRKGEVESTEKKCCS